MIRGAIFPHSRSGMIGAVMLGLGRAMGETIAAALVIGSSARLTLHLFSSGDAMAAVIANQFGESGGLHRSALVAMGVVLFAMTIVVNMVARAIAGKIRAGRRRSEADDEHASPDRLRGPPDRPHVRPTSRRPAGSRNNLATAFVYLSVLVAAIPLGFVLLYVVKKGAGVVDLDFLTKDIPIVTRLPGPGMGPAIAGTLLITLAATLMAVPLGILAAVYVTEYGQGSKLAAAIRFLSDVMAGVPSIVMGLFIYTIWVLRFGQSAFAGALALGALMLPIVIRSTESMLRLVPNALREGSAALGASKSRMIMTVVLPGRPARHHQRQPAGRGPGRGRDGPAAVHHRRRPSGQPQPLRGFQRGPVDPDLRQRPAAVPRRPGPGVGRGPHPHRPGPGADHRRPHDLPAVHPALIGQAPGR